MESKKEKKISMRKQIKQTLKKNWGKNTKPKILKKRPENISWRAQNPQKKGSSRPIAPPTTHYHHHHHHHHYIPLILTLPFPFRFPFPSSPPLTFWPHNSWLCNAHLAWWRAGKELKDDLLAECERRANCSGDRRSRGRREAEWMVRGKVEREKQRVKKENERRKRKGRDARAG